MSWHPPLPASTSRQREDMEIREIKLVSSPLHDELSVALGLQLMRYRPQVRGHDFEQKQPSRMKRRNE
ncbi:hypothetical protein TNCV_325671 [Trichonephila clavipes]|nr:hypothetical protein TNCV_325671 [Trichonephila clavipes]